MKTTIITLLAVLAHLTMTESCFAEDKTWWTRAITGEESPDVKGKRLKLEGVTQDGSDLTGELSLGQDPEAAPAAGLVIQGHLDRAGMFSPNLLYEVANGLTDEWKSVESSFSDNIEVTLTGAPDVRSISMLVSLDPFQPFIGKYRLGRITLQTGEMTVFSLLLLTKDGARQ
jgi:hypothetical protein